MQNLYCKIFVDTEITTTELLDLVRRIAHGERQIIRTVASTDYEADIVDNDDFDPAKSSDAEDGFLFYRYYLDVVPTNQTSREAYIKQVGDLLEGLWQHGCGAVAACSFEDELPRRGGYRNPNHA